MWACIIMKKILYTTLSFMAGVCLLASCEKDGKKLYPITETTFNDQNGLTINYSGSPLLGKTVKFTQDANDRSQARLVMNGVLDISNLLEAMPTITTLPAAGVIPGSKETTLSVNLVADTDTSYTFSGDADDTYCTYSYSGKVSDSSLSLDITNASLKDKTLCGKWNVVPYVYNDSDPWNAFVESTPTHVVWESDSKVDLLGSPNEMQDLLSLLLLMPIIGDEEPLNIPQALATVLKSVDFREDGNLVASFLDVENEATAFIDSPVNLANYVVKGEGNFNLYLNAAAIIAEATRADITDVIDLENILGNVIAQLIPMLSDGIPMHYKLENGKLLAYLGEDVLLPLLKENVSPILSNPEAVQAIIDSISGDLDPDMAGLVGMILPSMLPSIAEVIDNTTKLEIGINLKK